MGIPGPKPKPGNIISLTGRSHHKKKETIQVPPADCVRLSDDLEATLPVPVLERAKATLAIMAERKVLGVCDLESFERYCQHLRLSYEADAILRVSGLIVLDEKGNPHKHPATQIHRDNSLAALRYEEQFGLTPSARMRLTKTDGERKEDDYADYRKKARERAAG